MRNIKQYDPRTVNNDISSLKTLNIYLLEKGVQKESAVLDSDFMKIQIQYASPCTVKKMQRHSVKGYRSTSVKEIRRSFAKEMKDKSN